MDVSKADPRVSYGVDGELQKSTDGGRSWSRVGPAPEGLIGLATSSIDADRLYATTRRGLLVSTDGGRGWRRSPPLASMVKVTPEGTRYRIDRHSIVSGKKVSNSVALGGSS